MMPTALLPYVPFIAPSVPVDPSTNGSTSTPTVTPEFHLSDQDRIKLLQFTIADLSTLLQLNPADFLESLTSSASITDWISGYLISQTDRVTASHPFFGTQSSSDSMSGLMHRLESKLLRKVFQLACRICSIPEGVSLMTLPMWMSFARVFAHSNLTVMGELWFLCTNPQEGKRPLIEDVESAQEVFVSLVRGIQKRVEKGVSVGGGSGGGKGKGKASSSSSSSASAELVDTSRDLDDIRMLSDAILSFDAILLVASTQSRSLSDTLVKSPSFLDALIGCYAIANVLSTSHTHLPSSHDTITNAETIDPNADIRHLKLSVLALLDSLLTVSFFTPLQLPHTPETSIERPLHSPTLPETELPSYFIEPLCSLLLSLLDSSPIDGPVSYLTTAPLLVDLEVETGVSDRLKSLKQMLGEPNGSEARLDFLVVSLEQMLAFSGNALARNDRIEERRARAVEVAAKQVVSSSKKRGSKKAHNEEQHTSVVMDDDFIHRTILISQVQDLFPELGEGFIEACLVALNNDTEQLIMKILEDNLPDQVQKLDRSMARSAAHHAAPTKKEKKSSKKKSATGAATESWPSLGPDSNVLASRKNVFDNDEFDVFGNAKVDAAKVIWGKKEKTSGDLLDGSSDQKTAILALHASAQQEETEYERQRLEMEQERVYDDEYDDTYDSTDIKLAGTVELHMLDESENSVDSTRISRVRLDQESGNKPKAGNSTNAIEEELFAIAGGPGKSVLEKISRKSVARQRLKAKLGWSDEQIEGWFVMYQRNPNQQRRLEEQFAWRGNKPTEAFVPKEPKGKPADFAKPVSTDSKVEVDGDENGESAGPRFGPDAGRGGRVGSGASRGGRGGSSRGGKANHSRRDQHAKKMSRGMGGPI
ncbi:hypothetical protein HDU98_008801 [Podochytrium sp. JEL0797]|nr:hypothetical protein HDU98_008801 [Podochytrium sp. JEL0797]